MSGNNNNNMMPSEPYGNTQSSGYESMSDPFFFDYPSSQEMGPPPLPNRFQQPQQQSQQHMQQSMDHRHSQMGDNQQWQPQEHSQYQDNRHQQMPQQHFQQQQYQQPPQQQQPQVQQQIKQIPQQSPQPQQSQQQQQAQPQQSQPPQQQSQQQQTPQQPSSQQSHESQSQASVPPAPSAPQFRIQSQPPAPPKTSSSSAAPQFVINQSTSSSRSSTPVQADKTRINVLRQQVLHPVDPKIAEKMHKAPAPKPRDNAAEMLMRMKDYESVIPDAAAKYMMTRTGTAVDDDICYRMLAISAQKFASDILSDSITIARSRGLGQTNRATKETKYVLTQELLKEVFSEHGIKTFNA